MPSFDAIVVGGGTNGLACATRLGQAGRSVLVLEGERELGGAARARQFAPGYRSPGLAHLLYHLDPRVAEAMDLARHGLDLVSEALPTTALSATGDHLVCRGAFAESVEGDLSPADRAAWPALRAELLAFATALAPFREVTPPRLARGTGNDYLRLARLALGVRALGRERLREFMRLILINVHDVLNDELADPRLKGLIAFDATLGAWLGPRSPNTLILLLNRLAGIQGGRRAALALPRGGMEWVATAMARSAATANVVIRCGARVERLLVENDRVVGVRLADGEVMRAKAVISAVNPKHTFFDLVGPRHLDAGFVRRLGDQKTRGAAAKLHLALAGVPEFRGADLHQRLVIAPSETAVDEAFNAVKYGEVPDHPVMELVVPSAFEPTFAPPGHHVLSAIVQFAPHAPKLGRDAARARLLDNCLVLLERYAPGIGAMVRHAELLMPYDIEESYGLAGGNWHHGELSVEQMFFLRPLAEIAQYAAPLAGLWLAGAGCHPGGGISGAAGWNAAGRIIEGGEA
jgi:phytoene dehydrogenase-like protein